jgi:hypothetical protein
MTGFYELLQVPSNAAPEALRAAYQEQVAQVVRRLRAAESRQQDSAPIEARRAALAEAWSVLSDPARRRRYDRYRELTRSGLPTTLDDLWAQAGSAMVDPAAAAAVDVLTALTDLRVGTRPAPEVPSASAGTAPPSAVTAPEPPAAPPVDPPDATTEVSPMPRSRPTLRTIQDEQRRAVEPTHEDPATDVAPAPAASSAAPRPKPLTATQGGTAPAGPLVISRNASPEELARMLDRYGPTGAFLAAVRELRRVPVDQLSESTRISQRYIEAIERDAYAELPGAVFVRGYVRMLVQSLEAIPRAQDAAEYVDGFMARFHRARG